MTSKIFLSAVTVSLVPEARGGPFVFRNDLEAACAKAAELGFDAVEVFPPSADALNARELKKLLDAHGLKLAAIGTGAGWVVQRLRLTDPDAQVRRRAIDFVGAIVDLAGSFGAPGIIGSMQGRVEADTSHEQALAWLSEAVEQLGPRAHGHGAPLLLEPLNRYETNLLTSVSDASAFIDSLRTKNVKLLCDLFHMNIEEASVPDALRRAGSRVGHVHFADSNRRAVGLGHTNMPPIIEALREIGFSGCLSAEVLPLPDSEAAAQQTIDSFRKLTQ